MTLSLSICVRWWITSIYEIFPAALLMHLKLLQSEYPYALANRAARSTMKFQDRHKSCGVIRFLLSISTMQSAVRFMPEHAMKVSAVSLKQLCTRYDNTILRTSLSLTFCMKHQNTQYNPPQFQPQTMQSKDASRKRVQSTTCRCKPTRSHPQIYIIDPLRTKMWSANPKQDIFGFLMLQSTNTNLTLSFSFVSITVTVSWNLN